MAAAVRARPCPGACSPGVVLLPPTDPGSAAASSCRHCLYPCERGRRKRQAASQGGGGGQGWRAGAGGLRLTRACTARPPNLAGSCAQRAPTTRDVQEGLIDADLLKHAPRPRLSHEQAHDLHGSLTIALQTGFGGAAPPGHGRPLSAVSCALATCRPARQGQARQSRAAGASASPGISPHAWRLQATQTTAVACMRGQCALLGAKGKGRHG